MIIFYTELVGEAYMDRYELAGRIVFKAKDILDAFKKLSDHFGKLSKGQRSDLPVGGTDVRLKKKPEEPSRQALISTIPPPPRIPKDLDRD